MDFHRRYHTIDEPAPLTAAHQRGHRPHTTTGVDVPEPANSGATIMKISSRRLVSSARRPPLAGDGLDESE